MPAYNSRFNEEMDYVPRLIGNVPLLPLRTRTRGPAEVLPSPNPPLPPNESPEWGDSFDIVDEALQLFRANTFFRNFEIQGPADRLLIYGILFISECLSKIRPTHGVRDATKEVMNSALDLNFSVPGDPGFPLNQMYEAPHDRQDAEQLRQYLAQVRQELATRLLARVYEDSEDGKPSKWWLSFTKRKFMGKAL
ncbi:ARP2/3 complex ARPC3 subunit [Xylaria flabelliformis]|nr:ARP2/3 complex ARPC3 subunit [Xylaria flabelliformis]